MMRILQQCHKILFFLLFPILCLAQWGEWSFWGAAGIDNTPPPAPLVTLVRNDADSTNISIDFRGTTEIDSIFLRKKNGSAPTSKTDGDSLYTGTDTSAINSKTFAHGLTHDNTVYVRAFVQDTIPNISYGSASLAVDEWPPDNMEFVLSEEVGLPFYDVSFYPSTCDSSDKDSIKVWQSYTALYDNDSTLAGTVLVSGLATDSVHAFEWDDDTIYVWGKVQDEAGLRSPAFADTLYPSIEDVAAPNTTGTLVASLDSALLKLKFDETTIGSDSGDVGFYKYYYRHSAKDYWTFVTQLADAVDYTLTLLYSPGVGDSTFIKVAALDTNYNEDATPLLDTLVHATPQVLAFFTSDTPRVQLTEVTLIRNPVVASETGANTLNFLMANIDTSATDTLKVPILASNNFLINAWYCVKVWTYTSNWIGYPGDAPPSDPDVDPPNTNGTLAASLDSALLKLVFNETSVGSDSPDVKDYSYYYRVSPDTGWTYVTVMIDAIDTTIVLLYSPGVGDTIFTMIQATDSLENLDQTGIRDTLLIGSPLIVLFTIDTTRASVAKATLFRNPVDSTQVGADSVIFLMANIDTTTDADTMEVPLCATNNYLRGAWYMMKVFDDTSSWRWYDEETPPDSAVTFAVAGDALGKDTLRTIIKDYQSPAPLDSGWIFYKLASAATSIADSTGLIRPLFAVADSSTNDTIAYSIDWADDATIYAYFVLQDSLGNTQVVANANHAICTVDSLTPPAGGANWDFYWTGDVAGDSLDAYVLGSLTTFVQGNLNEATIPDSGNTGHCVKMLSQNDCIRFQSGIDSTMMDDDLGTIFADVNLYAAPSATVVVFEFEDSSTPTANSITLGVTTGPYAYAKHEGNNAIENKTGTDAITTGSWIRIGMAWDRANQKLSVKVGANAWQEDTEDAITDFAAGEVVDRAAVGEDQAGGTFTCKIRVDNVKVYPTYQATE